MKKIYFFIAFIVLLANTVFSQVTGTKNIPTDYPNVAAAVSALNAAGVGTGGATINVPAGWAETAPAGGYRLGSTALNASLSVTKQLVIQKSGAGANPVLTAPSGTSADLDGIFILSGTDYVTIDGIDLTEAAANTTAATAMEYGYALLNLNAAAPFDGCNNNSIQHCTITLNRNIHTFSTGIFMAHQTATAITALSPAASADLNSNNKFYTNTITNAVNGILIAGAANMNDQSNFIGGTAAGTGNTITNFIGTFYTSVGGITASYQDDCTIGRNTMDNTANGGVNAPAVAWGIYAYTPNGSYSISGNSVTMAEAAISTSYGVYGIYSNAPGANITATGNTVTLNSVSGSAAGSVGINLPGGNNTIITTNTVTQNLAVNTNTYGIYINSTGTSAITGNTIRQVATVAQGGQCYSIVSAGNGVSETISNNRFDNTSIAVAGTTSPVALIYTSNATPDKHIEGNNILGSLTINSSSYAYGIVNLTNVLTGTGAALLSGNNFSNISMSGTGGFYGVLDVPSTTATQTTTVSNNMFNNISIGSGDFGGIFLGTSGNNIIANDTITNISAAGKINGIYLSPNATAANTVYNNKLATLSTTATANTVSGITTNDGTTVSIYNNFIADLKAPATSVTGSDAVRGISMANATANTAVKMYHNSIYLNASSTGTDFSVSGIYHTADAAATTADLLMINNIIVNTSTPKGSGVVSAFHRSGTSLANYDIGSNNNDLYVGTPAANKVLYYDGTNADQTLAAYKTRVGPIADSSSISVMPVFVSPTDLHLTAANNCQLDGFGKPVAAVTIDIDGTARDANAPDIGADEFTGTSSGVLALASVPNSTLSVTRNISAAGTIFVAPNCDIIARVVPGTIGGVVKVAVVTDPAYAANPSYSFYNAQPYVRRHFDIEPVTNASTVTATVTLYFTDQDFTDYNTNNPLWPKLPTVAGGGNADPNKAQLHVTQYHGTPMHQPSFPGDYSASTAVFFNAPVINYNGSYWEVTVPATSFSGFYVHSSYFAAPLPITVNYLRGNKQGTTHYLNWSVTCNTTPTATMDLERSSDGKDFAAIHSITATALECGQPFNYVDAAPLAGINYYRLKMTDANEKFSYSNVITLINANSGLDVRNILPNPVTGSSFQLNVSSAKAGPMLVIITDLAGRVMRRQNVSLIAGTNVLNIAADGLAAGTYNVYGTSGNMRTKVLRMVRN